MKMGIGMYGLDYHLKMLGHTCSFDGRGCVQVLIELLQRVWSELKSLAHFCNCLVTSDASHSHFSHNAIECFAEVEEHHPHIEPLLLA